MNIFFVLDGAVYGISGYTLFRLLDDGEMRSIAAIKYHGARVNNLRGLAFHEQPDELWAIAPCGSLKGICTDALVRVVTKVIIYPTRPLSVPCNSLTMSCGKYIRREP